MPNAIIEEFTKDFRRLRRQKSRTRGGVEARMILHQCLYWGEHYSLHAQDAILTKKFNTEADKNKLRLVFNMTKRQVNRKIGRLWSIAHEYIATPNTRDAAAFDKAEVVSDLIRALDGKLEQHEIRWLLYYWMLSAGVAIEHIDWKEHVSEDVLPVRDELGNLLWEDTLTGEQYPEETVDALLQTGNVMPERFRPVEDVRPIGDVGSDVIPPFNFFIDASVTRVKHLGPDQACYIARLWTKGRIADMFGNDAANRLKYHKQDLSIIETAILDRGIPVAGTNLKDLLPGIEGSRGPDDPEMALVLLRYQPSNAEFGQGRRTYFVPDDEHGLLDDGSLPYPEIPVIDYHWGPPATTFWTTDFITDLTAPQKFLNKRLSQLGEASNAQLYGVRLLGPGIKKRDIPADRPADIERGINEQGQRMVDYVQPPQLPAFFPDSIRLVTEFIEQLGSADLLANRKFPGELRGSLTIPMLQEIIDSEDGPVYAHLGENHAREKQMRINRVKQYYPPVRTMNYTSADQQQEVLELHTEQILRAGVDFTISIEPGSLVPELASMRWARVGEAVRNPALAMLYTNPRTGQLDASKIAHDLRYSDRGRLSRENQYRKLARQIAAEVREGKIVSAGEPTQPNQPPPLVEMVDEQTTQPFVVYPFWDHNVMMDEYEAVMATTEFRQFSPLLRQTFLTLYETHRAILRQMQEQQMKAAQAASMQDTVAQVTQQTAAQVSSAAVAATVEQILAQGAASAGPPTLDRQIMSQLSNAGLAG